MLNSDTRRRIDACRDVLVGKIPNPQAQVEQITLALMYKFMNDMDREAEDLGGDAQFFAGDYADYSWDRITDKRIGGEERIKLYSDGIEAVNKNADVPELFREIFKNAYLPYRDPETFNLFAKEISAFRYDHSEDLGDAFEYLLSIMSSQGDAGQFRTPRHIIDFMVEVVEPRLGEKVLDPACGTAGFLIAAYKHIRRTKRNLSPAQLEELHRNVEGYDISPDMVRLSRVNLYLHQFAEPLVHEYDTLTDQSRWAEKADVILANPPFMSPKGGIRPHKKFGIASNRSEVLFVDYIMEHLEASGRAAVIVPEGIIFQSATAYRALRTLLLDGRLWAVASLPAGVFNPYSGVKTSILFLDRALARSEAPILFVKIEADGYDLGAQRRENGKDDLPAALSLLRDVRDRLRSGTLPADFHGSLDGHNSIGHLVIPRALVLAEADKNLSMERYRPKVAAGPKKWPMVKLGEVCETTSRGTPLKANALYWKEGTIPWLKSGEVAQGEIWKTEEFITDLGLKESSAKVLPVDTVLVAMYGATAGQVGILKISAATNQAVCGVLPNKLFNPMFLFHILLSKKDYMISLSSGGAQPNISQGIIRNLEIPLPPLSIQEEIVAEVKRYQAVIDGARAVTENWRPSFAVDPDWPTVKLGDIVSFASGGTPPKETERYWGGKIPWISAKDMKKDLILDVPIHVSDSAIKETATQMAETDALLILVRGMGLANGVPICRIGQPSAFNQDVKALILKESNTVDSRYLQIALKQDVDQFNRIITTAAHGTLKISSESLSEIRVPLPPLPIQQEIVARIEEERALVKANERLIELMKKRIEETVARVWE